VTDHPTQSAQLKKAENLSERYVEDGLSLARKYGPSIRMIVQILDGGQDIEYGYRQTLSSEAQDLVRTNRYIFNTLESSGLAEAPSSAVIFLRPSSLIKRYAYEFFVPTAEIARQLSVAALTVSSQDQQRFFSQMSSYPSTRSAAGWIFENFMHTRLTERDGHVRALDANYKEHDIPIVTSIITGSVEDLKSAPASFYWRPGESTFPGIDAVARDQNDIWAFQCTVSRRQRSTIDGLERVAQAIGIRESNWHLVIVGSEMPVAQSARAKQARLLEATKRWSSVKTFACELTLRSEAERLITLMSSVACLRLKHDKSSWFSRKNRAWMASRTRKCGTPREETRSGTTKVHSASCGVRINTSVACVCVFRGLRARWQAGQALSLGMVVALDSRRGDCRAGSSRGKKGGYVQSVKGWGSGDHRVKNEVKKSRALWSAPMGKAAAAPKNVAFSSSSSRCGAK
jgi:hypothetical protein